jgi:hypothetical protein
MHRGVAAADPGLTERPRFAMADRARRVDGSTDTDADYFSLPNDCTITLGTRVEL